MRVRDILPAWRRILGGYRPFLSLEITKECPLRCPGCYAYQPEHLGPGAPLLRQLSDYRGGELVRRAIQLVRELRPLHVSIIGGEPLVRFRELDELLPRLCELDVETQVVTSAVRRIPKHWAELPKVRLAVSIDGLAEDHDKRRAPATYARILEHIAGHRIAVHCTVCRQHLRKPGYLGEFARFWSARPEVRLIWFSLYTPQQGEASEERLTPEDREVVLRELAQLDRLFPKVYASSRLLAAYARPPRSPEECVFARVTNCLAPDFRTPVTPCQLGGRPVCGECGCIASAGMAALGRVRLGGLVPVDRIFAASEKVGAAAARRRLRVAPLPGRLVRTPGD